MPARGSIRRSAEERRTHVLEAGVAEFAEHGYHATRTAAVAARAGISQPYLYALFPDKKALFLACHRRVLGRIRDALAEAVRDGPPSPEAALQRMGAAYRTMLADRDDLLCHLQAIAASGDPEIRAEVRRGFLALIDEVAALSGASRSAVHRFTAAGLLLTVAGVLELPEGPDPVAPA